jgi:AraC-like DNA-binding protein
VSSNGHCGPGQALVVATFPMAPGARFEWHTHTEHQLAWAASGVLLVATETVTWVLPPTRALWIPAGLPHETAASGMGAATLRSAHVRPDRCGLEWSRPTPIAAGPLLAELITYLGSESLDADRRARAETVLIDLLEPVTQATIEVRLPTDERAREVAHALGADPSDRRTLAQWGKVVGASSRTLERAFLSETGVPFGRWRSLLRLQAALPALADGASVSAVARSLGYETASAFVAAFRRETGTTPGKYFTSAGP